MKLTPKQKEVISDVQKGAGIITNASVKGAIISFGRDMGGKQYQINNGVFWNLVKKGLIYQQQRPPFWYVLTEIGETIEL